MRKFRILFLVTMIFASLALITSCGNDGGDDGEDPGGGDPSTDNLLAPSDLIAIAISDTEIKLSWTDNSDCETGFKIERSLSAADGFAVVINADADSVARMDTDLEPSTKYYYRVRAFNEKGYTSYTAVVAAKTEDDLGDGHGEDPPDEGDDPPELTETAVAKISIDMFVDGSDRLYIENGEMFIQHMKYEVPFNHVNVSVARKVGDQWVKIFDPYTVWVLPPWEDMLSSTFDMRLDELLKGEFQLLTNLHKRYGRVLLGLQSENDLIILNDEEPPGGDWVGFDVEYIYTKLSE